MTEYEEEQHARAYFARAALLVDLVAYVRARAARCTYCPGFALWRWRAGAAGDAGHRTETLLCDAHCDAHKRPGAVPIAGADVIRRVAAVK